MHRIESKIQETTGISCEGNSLLPKKVTTHLTPSDIEWTETQQSTSNSNNSNSNHKTNSNSEFEAAEEISKLDLNSTDETLTEKSALEIADDSDSMRHLLQSLQQTVDNSKKVREEYQRKKAAYDLSRSSSNETANLCLSSEREILFPKSSRTKQKKSKRKKENKPEEQFKMLLEREKQLEQMKQDLLVDQFKNQLDEVETQAEANMKILKEQNEAACQTRYNKSCIPTYLAL